MFILIKKKIYKCDNDNCPRPGCYTSRGSGHPDVFECTREGCKGNFILVRYNYKL